MSTHTAVSSHRGCVRDLHLCDPHLYSGLERVHQGILPDIATAVVRHRPPLCPDSVDIDLRSQ